MALTVRAAEPEELTEAYHRILAPSYPAEEIETFAAFRDEAEDGQSRIMIGLDDGELVAAAVTRAVPPSEAVVLRAGATREDRRGAGFGSRLYRTMLAAIVAEQQPSLILAEAAHPDFHPPHPRHGDPLARLRFFGRFGARILELPYFQPARPGRAPVFGLLLLALYVRPDLINPARTSLDPAESLLAALRTMLRGGEESDEAATAALLTAASRGAIRLLPVEAYGEVAPGLRH